MRGDTFIRVPKPAKVFPDYGKGKCLYCGEPLPKGKRLYCRDWHGTQYRYESRDYEILNWAGIRELVLARDNHKCQVCGDPATVVHHETPISKGGAEYDQDNCISLCDDCHKNKHKKRMYEPRADTSPLESWA